jgi:hypothetical protein
VLQNGATDRVVGGGKIKIKIKVKVKVKVLTTGSTGDHRGNCLCLTRFLHAPMLDVLLLDSIFQLISAEGI